MPGSKERSSRVRGAVTSDRVVEYTTLSMPCHTRAKSASGSSPSVGAVSQSVLISAVRRPSSWVPTVRSRSFTAWCTSTDGKANSNEPSVSAT